MPTAGGKPAAEPGAGAGEKGGQARAGCQQGEGRAPAAAHTIAYEKHDWKQGSEWRVICGETSRGRATAARASGD